MTHPRPSRPLAYALGALLLVGCGGQAPVQLDVAPAGTTDEPVAEAPVTSRVRVTPGRADRPDRPEVATDTETVAPVAETSEPAPEPSSPASPLPADPVLVVDEDGCATDVATGIVVACHDPAAGPDDD